MTATPTFVQTPQIAGAAFTNADAANTKKTVATAGSAGSKVVSITATSTDSSARIAQLWLNRNGTYLLLGSSSVAANAGTDGSTAGANLLSLINGLPHDNDGQPYIFLDYVSSVADLLQVSFTTQVTTAKEIDVVAQYGNF